MKRLLVYCYFCPENSYRPGGVQQIVGPLLEELHRRFDWRVSVVHRGPCNGGGRQPTTLTFHDTGTAQTNTNYVDRCSQLNVSHYDILLSIDRQCNFGDNIPRVLMSNTLSYDTELSAAKSSNWSRIIVPTQHQQRLASVVTQETPIDVVLYGFSEEILNAALQVNAPDMSRQPPVVRLPHRPDPRKGHIEAIIGLSKALPASQDTILDISWLREKKYSIFLRKLQSIVRQRGIEHQVRFTGWKDADKKWNATADSIGMLQLGEFDESFGLAIIESILMGRPAITRLQPAVREIVGDTPLHREISNPLDWYDELLSFWDLFPNKDEQFESRRAIAEILTLEVMASHYDQILTRVCRTS